MDSTKIQGVPDCAILVHKAQGRVLLTDENGLYHKFISEALRQLGTNFLIILVLQDDEADSTIQVSFLQSEINGLLTSFYERFLYDSELMGTLAKKGAQPSLELLAKHFMVG